MANPQLSKSRLQALLAMATGTVAEPAAGLSGLYGLLTGGAAKGVRNIDATRAALTYAPSDPRGLQEIQGAVAPVAERWGQLRSYLGDTAEKHGASPALSTAAYMVPDTLATLLGARSMGVKGPELAQIAERSVGPTGPGRQLGIFAGKGAKTADLNAMAVAQQRLAQGADPRSVWRDTGWMQGPDGHMRFEIDDSQSRMGGSKKFELLRDAALRGEDLTAEIARLAEMEQQYGPRTFVKPYTETTRRDLGEVYDHNPLFDAYPELARGVQYSHRPDMGIGEAAHGYFKDRPDLQYIGMGPANEDVARSLMGHEVQHAVQDTEGFSGGASPYALAESANANVGDVMDAYLRHAGEAEARAVQKRLDYTKQQRRDIYPLDDYDTPLSKLIVR